MREGSKRPIVIVAACALLDETGAVLIAKRPPGPDWEPVTTLE